MQEIIDRILQALEGQTGRVKTVAIDGRCAAGKTTLAQARAAVTGGGVIHMDDFFLPPGLRTAARLAEPGGNVHYERFAEEVLPALGSGDAFSYRRFDCGSMQPGEERKVPEGALRIVEGAYSCHPRFGEYMAVRVFCDVPPGVQRRRIQARNGERALEAFLEKWIPLEERYLAAYAIREKAHIVPEGF